MHLSCCLRGPGPESRLKASALGWHSPPGDRQERQGRVDLWPFLSLWALGPPPKEEPCQSAMLVSGQMAEEARSPGFWGWEAFQNSPPAARAVPFCKQMAPSLLHLILLPVPCSPHCAWLFAVGRPGALQCPPCPCRVPGLTVLVNSPACSGSPHLFLHQLSPGALAPWMEIVLGGVTENTVTSQHIAPCQPLFSSLVTYELPALPPGWQL